MATARTYFGSTFAWGSGVAPVGPAGTYTTLALINDIEISGPSCGTKETTAHDSAGRMFVPTLTDWGEITVGLYWDGSDAGHAALMAMVGTLKYFQIAPKDDTKKWTGMGCVTKVGGIKYGIEDAPTVTITIKLSGVLAYA